MSRRAIRIGLVVIALLVVALFLFSFSSKEHSPKIVRHRSQLVFPQSVLLESENSRIAVRGEVAPMPQATRDYLLVGWFKLRDLPAAGQREILLSSLDFDSRAQPGIALAINRVVDSVRAEVYWRDSHGKGRWYTFGEGDFGPRKWFMLALSLRHGTVISLHTATRSDPSERAQLNLLGAYSFPEAIIPDANAALILGGSRFGGFVGRLGPLAVFSRYKLATRVERILGELVDQPAQFPSELSPQDALLWSPDLVTDNGPRKYELIPDKISRGKDDT